MTVELCLCQTVDWHWSWQDEALMNYFAVEEYLPLVCLGWLVDGWYEYYLVT